MSTRMRAPRIATLFVALAVSVSACVASESQPGLDAEPGVAELSVEALGVLELLNADSTTFDLLDNEVGLDRRAARNLIDHRELDGRFDSIAEVDAVSYVGPVALSRLADYARDHGWVPAPSDRLGTFDGVDFTVGQGLLVLELVNTATEQGLADDVDLDPRAVRSIAAARPLTSMSELAGLYYVGTAMLERLKRFIATQEIGLISDLDKTVIPPHDGALPDAPYPGVVTLYNALEGATPGDVYYVTARPEDMVTEIPAWLDQQGIPAGPIATGISPIAYIARDEKIRDISAILDLNPDQRFVLIGDTNHVDHEAYRAIIDIYGDRIVAAFVHDVKPRTPEQLAGLHVFDDHGQVAESLADLGIIDRATADAVRAEIP
jgi:DNA uptake protein ComE-like DNA-binding protein